MTADDVHAELVALRSELRRGFASVAGVLAQLLARLPESGAPDDVD